VKWLARLLGYVPAQESEGLSLPPGPHWDVDAPKEFSRFFRALVGLLPVGAVLYLEGGYPTDDISAFLEARRPTSTTKVRIGTIWPRPQMLHMYATPENLAGLAQLAEANAPTEIAVHIHAYKGNTMFVMWHDAPSDPICVSSDVSEERVQQFAAALGTSYRSCDKEV